jgi:hypothetical protein
MKEGYSIIKISYNRKDLEGLHPDVREGIDYRLVAAMTGLSRYIGGTKDDKKEYGFYLVFKPYKFLKALLKIKEIYPEVKIILEEEFSKN